jgi:hypothetical protein
MMSLLQDVLAIVIVFMYIMSFGFIIRDCRWRGKVPTIMWCAVNFCLPLIGFFIYCLICGFSKESENK